MNSVRMGFIGKIALVMLCILGIQNTPVYSQTDTNTYALAVRWSPDGNSIASVGIIPLTNEGYILIYDLNANQVLYNVKTQSGGYASVDWSPDSHYVAVGGYDQTVKIVDIKSKQVVSTLVGHRGVVNAVNWNSDGTRLVSSSPVDQQVILWDTSTYKQIRSLEIGDPWVVAFSPDDKNIAVGGGPGLFVFPSNLDVASGQYLASYKYSDAYVGALSWSHNGNQIAFGTQTFRDVITGKTPNPQVYVVNSTTHVLLNNLEIKQGGSIFGITWSPKDDQIATYSSDGAIKIWEAGTGILLDTFYGNKDYIETGLGFSHYGGRVAYGNSIGGDILSTSSLQMNSTKTISSLAGGIIQIVIPTPSTDKLLSITQDCGIHPSIQQQLTAQINTNKLQAFTTEVSALTDAQIVPGCKADLLAVANALMAKAQ